VAVIPTSAQEPLHQQVDGEMMVMVMVMVMV